MKKMTAAILLFDMIAGVLFMGLYGLHGQAVTTDSGVVQISQLEKIESTDEVRKIAITFDDEVIIGLSQEICYIEAISLI